MHSFFLLVATALVFFQPARPGDIRNPKDRNGLAVVIAFPEKNIALPTDPTIWNKMARLLDFDGDDHWRVGHGGMLIIDKKNGQVDYVDFGRYDERTDLSGDRPENYGIVRTSRHVPELRLPVRARFEAGFLTNLDTILIYLSEIPLFEGYGRMEAAVYDDLILGDMWAFVREQERAGYIRYGCPTHQYCTRFTRQVIRKGGGRYGLGIYTGKQMVRWQGRKL